MARPKNWRPYTTKDGAEVPSTTTITGRFKESGGLLWWSWNEGKQGRDFRDTKDAAADAGTLAHAMVESDIRGKPWTDPLDVDAAVLVKAKQAFQNYQTWRAQTHLTPVETEVRLVSERYRFGGTLDAMLVAGALALGDWKASNSVYVDYLLQLAAYRILWEENFPERPITGGFHLIRFSKETADFAQHHYGELDEAAEMFLCLRRAFDLDRSLKKRVK
jgi:hypothetical protein